jgi:hypothetical protein
MMTRVRVKARRLQQPYRNPLLFIGALITALLLMVYAAQSVRADDAADIKTVIESQLNAFAADDGTKAYSFAAPIVQSVFPNPDTFMAMVKKGYQPVYRNSARSFSEAFQDGLGRPAMRVILTAQDGKRYEALYSMEKQKDGTWKIAGCVILPVQDQEV